MKFLITADFHIENNKNLSNIIETSKWILSVCKSESINEVYVLGDFLNSRDKIDSLAINTAVDILDSFVDSSIKINLLLGNHEKYSKSIDFKVNSIKVFKKHANVIDKFKVVDKGSHYFIFIPFINETEIFDAIVDKIKEKVSGSNKKTILFLHQPIKGAIVNEISNFIEPASTSTDVLKQFDFVFSGHFHKYQTLSNCTYVGSPVQLTHNEERSEKGVLIFDLENESCKFVINPKYSKYVTTSDENCEVNGKYVRFICTEYKDPAELKRIRDVLISSGATDVRIEFLLKEQTPLNVQLSNINLTELTKKYIEANKGELNGNKLFEIGNKIRKIAAESLIT